MIFQQSLLMQSDLDLYTSVVALGWYATTERFLKAINELDSEFMFGKILTKINRSGEITFSSFQSYRSIDNLLSHKGREYQDFTKSDADWLFSYVTRDFRGLYECFT